MKTYGDLMVEITKAVQERSVHFYIIGIDESIDRDEIDGFSYPTLPDHVSSCLGRHQGLKSP